MIQLFKSLFTTNYNRVYSTGGGVEHISEDQMQTIAINGYRKNAFVRSAIKIKANTKATLPVKLVEYDSKGKWVQVYDHPALDILKKPNGQMGKTQFLVDLFSTWEQYGESFTNIQMPLSGINAKKPKNLIPMRPDIVRVVEGNTEAMPVKEYVASWNREVKLKPELVIHVKNYNPINFWRGSSDLFAVGDVIDLNNAFIKWNNQVTKNKGVPPFYLHTDRYLTEQQADDIANRAKSKMAGDNQGKPFVTYKGLMLKELGFRAQDIEWFKGLNETGRQILYAKGLPPEMIMVNENINSGNREIAERAYYLYTAIPEAMTFWEYFGQRLLDCYSDTQNMAFIIDQDDILALVKYIEQKHKMHRADYLSGITYRNEARDHIGEEPLKDDVIVMPQNVGELGSDVNPDAGGNGRGNTEDLQ